MPYARSQDGAPTRVRAACLGLLLAVAMVAQGALGLAAPTSWAADGTAEAEVTGTVVRLADAPGGDEISLTRPDGSRIALVGAGSYALTPGAAVRVRGPMTQSTGGPRAARAPVAPTQTMAVRAAEVLAGAAPASVVGDHGVAVVRVIAPDDRAAPPSEASVRERVAQAAAFWSDQSGGALRLRLASVSAPVASVASCQDPFAMRAELGRRLGLVDSGGQLIGGLAHLIFVYADDSVCPPGLGSVGTGSGTAWISDATWTGWAHELGHNLGLGHADALRCPSAPDVDLASGRAGECPIEEYGDYHDVMGAEIGTSQAPMLSAVSAAEIGLFPAGAMTTVTRTQTVTLAPLSGLTGVRAARVVDPRSGLAYVVEYRVRAGRDADSVAAPGVRVTRMVTMGQRAGDSVVLDPTPTPGATSFADQDRAIRPGTSLTSHTAGVSVTVVDAGATSATVTVTVDGGAPALPGTTPSPVNPAAQGNAVRGDFSGDGLGDLVTIDRAGRMTLGVGSGSGTIAASRSVAGDWSWVNWIGSPGDVDRDGHADLMARAAVGGTLYLYPGDGAGGFATPSVIGTNWNGMARIIPMENMRGDDTPLIIGAHRNGTLYRYDYRPGAVTLQEGVVIGTDFDMFKNLLSSGDFDGDRRSDLLGITPEGDIFGYFSTDRGTLSSHGKPLGTTWTFPWVSSPGDLNGDGFGDITVVNAAGDLYTYFVKDGHWNGLTKTIGGISWARVLL